MQSMRSVFKEWAKGPKNFSGKTETELCYCGITDETPGPLNFNNDLSSSEAFRL